MSYDNLDLTVLKHIITSKKNGLDFANNLDSKLFTPETWNFANLVINHLKFYKETPTLRIITEKLAKSANAKLSDSVKVIWAELNKTVIDESEYKHDIEKLKHRFAEKQIILAKESLSKLELGSIDVGKTVSDIQKTIQSVKSLNQTKAYERKTLKEAVPNFCTEYNAKMEDETFDAGIKTGYSYLDHVSDGLRPGELLLIGGESGSGKSMLLMNMAVQMWMQNNTIHTEDSEFSKGYNVLYFSLEMPFKPCLNRVLGRLSGSPTKAIRAAKLNETESAQLKKALRFIKRYPYQFEIVDIPRGATMENLELLYADAKSTYNPDIVVIDYIGLMEYDGAETEDWLKLGKIAEKCHEFSRVNDCITLSAVQLNRAQGKTEDDRIGLHRIGRSAMIMHNANIALQINKRSAEHQYPDMEYFVIKCRDGELGKGRIIKDLKCGTLLDDKTGDNKIEEQFTDVDDISSRMDSLDE